MTVACVRCGHMDLELREVFGENLGADRRIDDEIAKAAMARSRGSSLWWTGDPRVRLCVQVRTGRASRRRAHALEELFARRRELRSYGIADAMTGEGFTLPTFRMIAMVPVPTGMTRRVPSEDEWVASSQEAPGR